MILLLLIGLIILGCMFETILSIVFHIAIIAMLMMGFGVMAAGVYALLVTLVVLS